MAKMVSPSASESTARFAWLLSIGRFARPERLNTEDAATAIGLAARWWQLAPVILPTLRPLVRGQQSIAGSLQQLDDLATSVSTLTRVQNLLCRRFASELEARRIPYTLLKGSAARLMAYPATDVRGGLDVDVGVPRRWIYSAADVAHEQGFVAASLTDSSGRHFELVDPLEREIVESEHYELACLVRRQIIADLPPAADHAIRNVLDLVRPWHTTDDGRLACYVTLDLHHGLCLDIPVDDVVSSATLASTSGQDLRVPAREWFVFHLIFKIYWEGVHNYGKGVYQYADLVRVVADLTPAQVTRLISLLVEYRLEAAGHYVLRRVPAEFGVQLPQELQAYIDQTRSPPDDAFPLDVNDLGDMWPKLWGVR